MITSHRIGTAIRRAHRGSYCVLRALMTTGTAAALLCVSMAQATVIVNGAVRSLSAQVGNNNPAVSDGSNSSSGVFNALVESNFRSNHIDDSLNRDHHAEATQNTDFQPMFFSGSGAIAIDRVEDVVAGGNQARIASAQSFFRLTFTLTTAYQYTSEIAMLINKGGTADSAADVRFSLSGINPVVFPFDLSTSDVALTNQLSGVLDPGVYVLLGQVRASTSDPLGDALIDASYNFNFALRDIAAASVPEPSPLGLLALGLLAFGFGRRCRWRV